MNIHSKNTTAKQLYEADFHDWCMEQAELLRVQARSFGDNRLDYENLAEEIESLGISDRRELKSRLEVLLVHLLKWRHQKELRGRGWQSTIRSQRKKIADLLSDSPSLRNLAVESLQLVYERAIEEAAFETGLDASAFPTSCPFGADEVFDAAFFPNDLDA